MSFTVHHVRGAERRASTKPKKTHQLAGPAVVRGYVLQLQPHLLADHLPPRQHGDVLQGGLAVVSEPGRLHGAHLAGKATEEGTNVLTCICWHQKLFKQFNFYNS